MSPVPAHNRCRRAFSLVEVVMALGIATFCLVALLSLFSVALRLDRETQDVVNSSATASVLLEAFRVDPGGTNFGAFPLPAPPPATSTAAVVSDRPVLIDAGGRIDTAHPVYALSYRMQRPEAGSDICRVFLRLSTPPQVDNPRNQNHYELISSVRIP